MLTAFLSVDVSYIKNFFYSLFPFLKREQFEKFVQGFDLGLAGVVRGQVIICLLNGFLTLIGLLLFDIKFAFIMAIIAATFSLVPIFGSILSSIPIVLIAVTDSFIKGIFILVWIIGIHLIEANFFNPKIMGNAAKIHPVVVIMALLAGKHYYGIIGALFAVPAASIVLTIFKFLHQYALQLDKENGS